MSAVTSAREISVLATGVVPHVTGLGHGFLLHDQPSGPITVDRDLATQVRAIAAAGPRRITDDVMAQLPNLELVANFGVGVDRVDVDAASRRGVIVTNTPDVLTEEVADFTLGLLISTVRRLVAADQFVRAGNWSASKVFPLSSSLRGRKVGIVGMGRIGEAVARRCAGMGLDISYYSRSQKPGLPYAYQRSLLELASAVSVLIVVVPATPETDKIINAEVISALGPDGVLINVARGAVVDEEVLIDALTTGQLLAAGLDVFVGEPQLDPRFLTMSNVTLTPHIGSASLPTRQAMGDLVFANVVSWFGGKGALTPVNHAAVKS